MQASLDGANALEHLSPVWFVPVMGWCGLAQAWLRASDLGEGLTTVLATLAGLVALGIFVVVIVLSLVRWSKYPSAVAIDIQHPVRHPFLATIPISIMLLASLGVAMFWNASESLDTGLCLVWAGGSLLEIAATVWVTARWLKTKEAGGPSWNAITPILFIPVVGNALAPIAGLTIGLEPWAMAQFGLGLFLWPVMQTLLVVRWVHVGPMPPRMVPALFIMVVPPSIVGLDLLLMGVALPWIWCMWGIGAFFLALALTQIPGLRSLPFGMPHWGMSFPIAAFTILTLRLAALSDCGWLVLPGYALLAVTSLLVLWLSFATLRGLLNGSLLAPEAG
jgi:tellurite resistance protein